MITRRRFVASSAALGAASVAVPFIHASTQQKKFRTALIGSGWWGMNILEEAIKQGRTRVVALSDPDPNVLEVTQDQVKGLNGDVAKTYKDYRELIEREKPEVVIIATPDHWHALPTIAALKAGAHVLQQDKASHQQCDADQQHER